MKTAVTSCGVDNQRGVSLIEVLIVVALLAVVGAISAGPTLRAVRAFRLGRDAEQLSSMVALAGTRAASNFTHARVYADLNARTLQAQVWKKAGTPAWVPDGPLVVLSAGISFGFAGLGSPPPNTQASISQAPACVDADGTPIPGTACIMFNSRSLPVDSAGNLAPTNVFYLASTDEVRAVAVSSTGVVRSWSSPSVAANWSRR